MKLFWKFLRFGGKKIDYGWIFNPLKIHLTKYEVKIIIFKEIKFRVIPKTRNGTNGNGTEKNRAKTRKRNFRTRNN
jgi:hypothetical protein